MEPYGERDMRSAYCAMAIAKMCNILTPELEDGVFEYIINTQTHEGGFGGI